MIFTYPLGTHVTVSGAWFPSSIKKCNLGLSAIKRELTYTPAPHVQAQ